MFLDCNCIQLIFLSRNFPKNLFNFLKFKFYFSVAMCNTGCLKWPSGNVKITSFLINQKTNVF